MAIDDNVHDRFATVALAKQTLPNRLAGELYLVGGSSRILSRLDPPRRGNS